MKSFGRFFSIALIVMMYLFSSSAHAQTAPVPLGVVTLTANDTLLDPGQTEYPNPVYKVGALTGSITLTLPHVSRTAGAQHITVINMFNQGVNTITGAAQSGDSVNGGTSYTGLTQQYQEVTFWCDPSISGKWFLLDNGYSTAGGDLTGTYPNPTLKLSGVKGFQYTKVTNTTTLTAAQAGYIADSCTAVDTLTLPAVATVPPGTIYIIQDYSGNGLTDTIKVKPNASETINGSSAVTPAVKTAYGVYRLIAVASTSAATTSSAWRSGW